MRSKLSYNVIGNTISLLSLLVKVSESSVLDSSSVNCPFPRGQFEYKWDCHKFVDCWENVGVVRNCFPNTLIFDPVNSVCDWPHKGLEKRCQASNNEDVNYNNNDLNDPHNEIINVCPPEMSGLRPHPEHCHQFVECFKGNAVVKQCAEGTLFNAHSLQCDFKEKVSCQSGSVHTSISEPDSLRAPTMRLWGAGKVNEGFVQLKLFDDNEWYHVCTDDHVNNVPVSNVICNHLGFERGPKPLESNQFYDLDNTPKILRASINCQGNETDFEHCITIEERNVYDCPKSSLLSASCVMTSLASCDMEDEVAFGSKCYSFHKVPKLNFVEANYHCRSRDASLILISNEKELNFVLQMLEFRATESIWTSNRHSEYTSATVLNMDFSLTEHALTSSFSFVCQRLQRDIGCVRDKSYEGTASRTDTGKTCRAWDSVQATELLAQLDVLGAANNNNYCRNPDNDIQPWCLTEQGQFEYCDIPQCQNEINGVINVNYEHNHGDYEDNIAEMESFCSDSDFRCDIRHYSGANCIPAEFVCDGRNDCVDASDEQHCSLSDFELRTRTNSSLMSEHICEKFKNLDVHKCAEKCKNAPNCPGFYFSRVKTTNCLLMHRPALKRAKFLGQGDFNYNNNDNFNHDFDFGFDEDNNSVYEWQVYVPKEICTMRCPDGRCVSNRNECFHQERPQNESCDKDQDCISSSITGIQVELINPNDSSVSAEGRVQLQVEVDHVVRLLGGVCDDGFTNNEANVLCRMAGFDGGAREIFLHSHFGAGEEIVLDDLNCLGNETSIVDCQHKIWGEHDCSSSEFASIVCNTDKKCDPSQDFSCVSTDECVNLEFVCDQIQHCSDNSDENQELCRHQDINVRLVEDGNARHGLDQRGFGHQKVVKGRLEVRRKGFWGTVCDDDFGPRQGRIACKTILEQTNEDNNVIRVDITSSNEFSESVSKPIWRWALNDPDCFHQNTLESCLRATNFCTHREDVWLVCQLNNNNDDDDMNNVGYDELCGQESSLARVSGGQRAPDAPPWTASIRLRTTQTNHLNDPNYLNKHLNDSSKGAKSKSLHWCGAVIIGVKHVLTAAHCMQDYPKQVYVIRVGDFDSLRSEPFEKEYDIAQIHIHEEFNVGVYLNHDIAIVEISPDSEGKFFGFGAKINKVCLPHANTVYNEHLMCTVTGFGATHSSGRSRFLQTAMVPVIPWTRCSRPDVYGQRLSSSMFCAGHMHGGVDTCQGDSGGPLLCNVHNQQVLFGLTSWGQGCGRPKRPGVYTRVAHYLHFIREKTGFIT